MSRLLPVLAFVFNSCYFPALLRAQDTQALGTGIEVGPGGGLDCPPPLADCPGGIKEDDITTPNSPALCMDSLYHKKYCRAPYQVMEEWTTSIDKRPLTRKTIGKPKYIPQAPCYCFVQTEKGDFCKDGSGPYNETTDAEAVAWDPPNDVGGGGTAADRAKCDEGDTDACKIACYGGPPDPQACQKLPDDPLARYLLAHLATWGAAPGQKGVFTDPLGYTMSFQSVRNPDGSSRKVTTNVSATHYHSDGTSDTTSWSQDALGHFAGRSNSVTHLDGSVTTTASGFDLDADGKATNKYGTTITQTGKDGKIASSVTNYKDGSQRSRDYAHGRLVKETYADPKKGETEVKGFDRKGNLVSYDHDYSKDTVDQDGLRIKAGSGQHLVDGRMEWKEGSSITKDLGDHKSITQVFGKNGQVARMLQDTELLDVTSNKKFTQRLTYDKNGKPAGEAVLLDESGRPIKNEQVKIKVSDEQYVTWTVDGKGKISHVTTENAVTLLRTNADGTSSKQKGFLKMDSSGDPKDPAIVTLVDEKGKATKGQLSSTSEDGKILVLRDFGEDGKFEKTTTYQKVTDAKTGESLAIRQEYGKDNRPLGQPMLVNSKGEATQGEIQLKGEDGRSITQLFGKNGLRAADKKADAGALLATETEGVFHKQVGAGIYQVSDAKGKPRGADPAFVDAQGQPVKEGAIERSKGVFQEIQNGKLTGRFVDADGAAIKNAAVEMAPGWGVYQKIKDGRIVDIVDSKGAPVEHMRVPAGPEGVYNTIVDGRIVGQEIRIAEGVYQGLGQAGKPENSYVDLQGNAIKKGHFEIAPGFTQTIKDGQARDIVNSFGLRVENDRIPAGVAGMTAKIEQGRIVGWEKELDKDRGVYLRTSGDHGEIQEIVNETGSLVRHGLVSSGERGIKYITDGDGRIAGIDKEVAGRDKNTGAEIVIHLKNYGQNGYQEYTDAKGIPIGNNVLVPSEEFKGYFNAIVGGYRMETLVNADGAAPQGSLLLPAPGGQQPLSTLVIFGRAAGTVAQIAPGIHQLLGEGGKPVDAYFDSKGQEIENALVQLDQEHPEVYTRISLGKKYDVELKVADGLYRQVNKDGAWGNFLDSAGAKFSGKDSQYQYKDGRIVDVNRDSDRFLDNVPDPDHPDAFRFIRDGIIMTTWRDQNTGDRITTSEAKPAGVPGVMVFTVEVNGKASRQYAGAGWTSVSDPDNPNQPTVLHDLGNGVSAMAKNIEKGSLAESVGFRVDLVGGGVRADPRKIAETLGQGSGLGWDSSRRSPWNQEHIDAAAQLLADIQARDPQASVILDPSGSKFIITTSRGDTKVAVFEKALFGSGEGLSVYDQNANGLVLATQLVGKETRYNTFSSVETVNKSYGDLLKGQFNWLDRAVEASGLDGLKGSDLTTGVKSVETKSLQMIVGDKVMPERLDLGSRTLYAGPSVFGATDEALATMGKSFVQLGAGALNLALAGAANMHGMMLAPLSLVSETARDYQNILTAFAKDQLGQAGTNLLENDLNKTLGANASFMGRIFKADLDAGLSRAGRSSADLSAAEMFFKTLVATPYDFLERAGDAQSEGLAAFGYKAATWDPTQGHGLNMNTSLLNVQNVGQQMTQLGHENLGAVLQGGVDFANSVFPMAANAAALGAVEKMGSAANAFSKGYGFYLDMKSKADTVLGAGELANAYIYQDAGPESRQRFLDTLQGFTNMALSMAADEGHKAYEGWRAVQEHKKSPMGQLEQWSKVNVKPQYEGAWKELYRSVGLGNMNAADAQALMDYAQRAPPEAHVTPENLREKIKSAYAGGFNKGESARDTSKLLLENYGVRPTELGTAFDPLVDALRKAVGNGNLKVQDVPALLEHARNPRNDISPAQMAEEIESAYKKGFQENKSARDAVVELMQEKYKMSPLDLGTAFDPLLGALRGAVEKGAMKPADALDLITYAQRHKGEIAPAQIAGELESAYREGAARNESARDVTKTLLENHFKLASAELGTAFDPLLQYMKSQIDKGAMIAEDAKNLVLHAQKRGLNPQDFLHDLKASQQRLANGESPRDATKRFVESRLGPGKSEELGTAFDPVLKQLAAAVQKGIIGADYAETALTKVRSSAVKDPAQLAQVLAEAGKGNGGNNNKADKFAPAPEIIEIQQKARKELRQIEESIQKAESSGKAPPEEMLQNLAQAKKSAARADKLQDEILETKLRFMKLFLEKAVGGDPELARVVKVMGLKAMDIRFERPGDNLGDDYGEFNPKTGEIIVNRDYAGIPSTLLVQTLAHELQHRSDILAGDSGKKIALEFRAHETGARTYEKAKELLKKHRLDVDLAPLGDSTAPNPRNKKAVENWAIYHQHVKELAVLARDPQELEKHIRKEYDRQAASKNDVEEDIQILEARMTVLLVRDRQTPK